MPLNSPRLLIRHWIPSTGLHTDKEAKLQEESISRPTQTDYAILNTKYYKIRDNNKHDTLHYSIEGHKRDDIPILKDKPPMYILLIDLPLLPICFQTF